VPEVFVVGRRQKLTKASMRSLLNFRARTFFPEIKSDDKLKTLLYLANGKYPYILVLQREQIFI